MIVYLKVTNDEYELPIAVADSGLELARITGNSKNTVFSTIARRNSTGKGRFLKIDIGDLEEDE